MDGGAPQSAGKGQKPRQNSLKKQNSGGGGYTRNSAPVYPQQQRRGPGASNYDFKSSFRNDDRGGLSVNPEGLWTNHALMSLLCNLIGCEVRFRLKDGREYEGVFEAFSPKGEFAFSLCCQLKNGCVPDTSKVDQQTIVDFKDVASLSAKAVNIVHLRTDFETDIGISQRISHGEEKNRQLEAWEPDADDNAMLELEDDGAEATSNNGGWSADDMFRKNRPLQDKEVKAGILKSSRHVEYDGKSVDPFSNVTADESEVTDEIREIAANIERTSTTTVERARDKDEDEEMHYSAVVGQRATWQPNQQGGRGGGNQRGGASRGRGGAGRGVPGGYGPRKNETRLPGLAPQMAQNQSPYQGQQSPQPGGATPGGFNRMPQQQPAQSTPPPGAMPQQQRGFSPKPSPPPLVTSGNFVAPSTPPQQPAYSAPISYASAVEAPQEAQPPPPAPAAAAAITTTTNGGASYSSAAAHSATSHYAQQPKGSWRQPSSNPQAVEQQKRDIVHHRQSQIDTIDRAAMVQDLKQTTASITVPSPQPETTENISNNPPATNNNNNNNIGPATSTTPTTQPSRQTVTVKAGGGSHQTAVSSSTVHHDSSSNTPLSGRESMDSLNVESTTVASTTSHEGNETMAAGARSTPVVPPTLPPTSTTPHPPASSTDNHSTTPSSTATPSSTTTTPSTSTSAMSNFLKKLNPLAEEFVPRGPASLLSPAPSTSVSAVQSPTAVSIASNVLSPPIAMNPVVPPVSLLTAAAAALPPPSLLPPNVGAPPPPVLSVISQAPNIVPSIAPVPQPPHPQPGVHHPPPSQPLQTQAPTHHPQLHHQGGGGGGGPHHRGGRNSQQFNNHNQQRQTAEYVPVSAAPTHENPGATAFALAHQQGTTVVTPQAWTTIMTQQTPQTPGAPQITAPYYQVATHPSAAVNAARFAAPNPTGTPHQVTVTAQFTRPPGGQAGSAGTPAGTPIMYTTQSGQQGSVVGKPGSGSEFTPTFSIVTPSPGQQYAVLQSASQSAQAGGGHPGVAFYPQTQASANQVMTIHQAASMQQSQHAAQQQTPQQTAQAVAQQIHQQQLQAAQHQQVAAQQQQQHLAQQLQQASLNGQTAQLVQQAIAAQQYQQQVAAAQAQQQAQQAHQNQQQQMLNAQQQNQQAVAAQNAAAMVSAQQHNQAQFAAPQTLLYYYPAAAGQAGAHQLLQSTAGNQQNQGPQMIPAQFYADARYAMPVVAQQTAQQAVQQGASHSNVATPAQTPTGSGPPFFFMTAPGGHGMQNIAYYPNLQLVTSTAQQVQPGQSATQPSGP